MLRQPVSSSNLSAVGYNSRQAVLEIEFHSGGVYQYFDVPAEISAGLMGAGSKGSYFHTYIRDRYAYRRVG